MERSSASASRPTAPRRTAPAISRRISADGRRVAFTSTATDLDPLDGDTKSDVYLRDLDAGTMTLSASARTASRTIRRPSAPPSRTTAASSRSSVIRAVFVAGDDFLDPRRLRARRGRRHDHHAVRRPGRPLPHGRRRAGRLERSVALRRRDLRRLLDPSRGRGVRRSQRPRGHRRVRPVARDEHAAEHRERRDPATTGPSWRTARATRASSCFHSIATTLVPGLPKGEHLYLRERDLTASAVDELRRRLAGHARRAGALGERDAGAQPRRRPRLRQLVGLVERRARPARIAERRRADALGRGPPRRTRASLLLPLPPGGGRLTGRVPPDEALAALHVYAQVLEIDPGATGDVAFTPGLDLTLGF